jgi:hypothetical protein
MVGFSVGWSDESKCRVFSFRQSEVYVSQY